MSTLGTAAELAFVPLSSMIGAMRSKLLKCGSSSLGGGSRGAASFNKAAAAEVDCQLLGSCDPLSFAVVEEESVASDSCRAALASG